MDSTVCPVCSSSHVRAYFYLRRNDLRSSRCKRCGHVFITNNIINASNAAEYYGMDEFKGKRRTQDINYSNYYEECFNDYENFLDSSEALGQFKEKIEYFNNAFPAKGKLLDIGCATGVFLDMARKAGWEAEGVEISGELADYAREHFGLKVHVGDVTKMQHDIGEATVICLFDVIEHLDDVHSMVGACHGLLPKGGMLLVRTPTEEGLLRGIAKLIYRTTLNTYEYPMQWFYSHEHIQSFSLRSLRALLERHGFSIVEVFREEESTKRLNISPYVRKTIQAVNFISDLLNKQHKITVLAAKQ